MRRFVVLDPGVTVTVAMVAACSLGDPSVYGRGDLTPSPATPAPNPPGTGSSTSSSSSSGEPLPPDSGLDAGSSGLADAAPDAAPVVCTDFAPPASWAFANRTIAHDYVAVGQPAGDELNYRVTGPASFDLSQGQSNQTCSHCIQWQRGGTLFFQRSGLSTVQASAPCGVGILANVTDLVLQEVVFAGGVIEPVAGGACLRATGPINVSVPTPCED